MNVGELNRRLADARLVYLLAVVLLAIATRAGVKHFTPQSQQSRQNYASNYDDYHPPTYGGYYHPSYDYGGAYAAGAVTGAVIGSTMTAAAFSAMSAPTTQVVVGGVTYYQVGSSWYQPMYQGGQVTYVVVQPPQ